MLGASVLTPITHLGFGGSNVVRFRIFPKGHLEGPEVLGYNGEKALIETSKRAVQVSAPFPPLPEDFPEKYLEVTASFHYRTMRKR
jgi:outer membrane biosynthesis protein TonB